MPPSTQVNPAIVSLMHGVVAAEGTNGNPNALGDKNAQGQYTAAGIGQWSNENAKGIPQSLQPGQIPTNFQNDAKQYGLDPTDFSLQNQNRVLAQVLIDGKNKGLTPQQQLSKWNSGDPNAFQNTPVEGSSVSATGTSNVADYVKRGMAAAEAFAQSQRQSGGLPQASTDSSNTGATLPQAATLPQTSTQTPTQTTLGNTDPGFMSDLSQGDYFDAAKTGIGNLFNFALPIVGDLFTKQGQQKTVGQKFADAGISALTAAMFIPGLQPEDLAAQAGLRGVAGKVVGNAVTGAAFGGLQAASQGGNANQTTQQGLLGTGVGATVGLLDPALGKILDMLPTSLTQGVFKGIDKETAQYALKNKPIGSVGKMLADSTKTINESGNQVKSILTGDKYATNVGNGAQSLEDTLAKFPNSEMTTPADVASEIKTVVPLYAKLVDKVTNGTATLAEKNLLRSQIDKNVYRGAADLPKLTASKTIANDFSNNLRKEVQTAAPETVPFFNKMSKEFPLQKVLAKMDKNSASQLGLYDILAALGGGMGGVPGAGIAVAGERAARSPAIRFGIAKTLSKLTPSLSMLGKIGGVSAQKTIPGLVSPIGQQGVPTQ